MELSGQENLVVFVNRNTITDVSDAPIGAFVSGGIDSSLIAALAIERRADLALFTANVLGPMSEFQDALRLSKHLDSELHAR